MRTRAEIEGDEESTRTYWSNAGGCEDMTSPKRETLILEVLLDIRELLQKTEKPRSFTAEPPEKSGE